jgi:hypothetical protein
MIAALFVNFAPMTHEVNGKQFLIVIYRKKDSIVTDAEFE